ncbi:hypothetical protein PQO03_17585 [Lentisphaera profundi]|uniref:Uncharacterized protein n=1 Tax=Lentisphaera profundi TaxID=1658616 RepID=A0ABY7VVA0_9BACT|nr:hypothetical protein [Lentisphaera profundi]WDE97642.1 hypothetical protein PQO03_17585 [Lentisphaera profundi]
MLCTQAPTKKDKLYEFIFKFKGTGQGPVTLTHQNFPSVFETKIPSTDSIVNLGILQKFEVKKQWQKAICTFKAKENPSKTLTEVLIFMVGSYQGELKIKNLSLKEINGVKSPLPPIGTIEIKNIIINI